MSSPFWEIRLNVRSGLVSGLLEAIAILIFAPLITRATTRVYNVLTTRRVLQGTPVKIRDNSLSVEDIIPRVIRVIRTASTRNPQVSSHIETPFADVTRQLLPLVISIVISVAIILTSAFINGTSAPVYTTNRMFLWNGGMFVDATSTGVNSTTGDILGMAGARTACVERVDSKTFNLYAVAFSEPQDFSNDRAANASVCVNGRDTKQRIGVTIRTDIIFKAPIPSAEATEDIGGTPANFTFLKYVRRFDIYDQCRVRVSTNGSSTDWTFGYENLGRRYATRATVDANGIITLRAGVAYRKFDPALEQNDLSRADKDCQNLTTEMFDSNRFTATITTHGIRQDLRQLELVVTDILQEAAPYIFYSFESQDVMFRSYYAGASVPSNVFIQDKRLPQSFGSFVPRQIETTSRMKQITAISGVAVIGFVLTIVGCFISFFVLIFVHPTVRVTSVSYISRLYSRRDVDKRDSDVMSGEVEYIGTEKSYDGSVHASPVKMKSDYATSSMCSS